MWLKLFLFELKEENKNNDKRARRVKPPRSMMLRLLVKTCVIKDLIVTLFLSVSDPVAYE